MIPPPTKGTRALYSLSGIAGEATRRYYFIRENERRKAHSTTRKGHVMKETKLNGNYPNAESGNRCKQENYASLDAWAKRSWVDGLQVDRLETLDTLNFQTQNSIYEITILCPNTGEVMVRGGRFFPERAIAFLAGSSLGGSFLKLRGIYPGFKIEFGSGGRRIITSRVRSIEMPDNTNSDIASC